MNPRIVFIAGPLKDSVFELGEAELSIGRDSTNLVRLADSLLSRRHCRIARADEHFFLTDLESLNGTFVNGRPVREHVLADGDQIAVGESRFVFLTGEGEPAAHSSNPVALSDREMTAHTTVRLKAGEALYLRPEAGWAEPPALADIARDLALLIRVSTSVNSIRETEGLQRELLRLVFEAVPAERGAILLVGQDGRLVSELGLDRAGDVSRTVEVSRTVVRQVIEEGTAVLAADLIEGGFDSSESLRAARLSSLLCAPLVLYGRALGALYLTAADPSTHFDEGHLQLVTVICGIAAVALDNARRLERLESENDLLRAESSVEHGMVGESAAMKKVYQFIARVAQADTTVLVRGESGTGKELAARALHDEQPAPRAPVRRHQLRGAHRDAAGVGAVRPRTRRVHRRARAEEGQARSRRRRHALPRRGRRDVARAPGEAPARAPGARVRARRRHAHHQRGRARRRGDEPRFGGGGEGGRFPAGLVLPPQRRLLRDAAAARSGARTSRCSPATSPRSTPRSSSAR